MNYINNLTLPTSLYKRFCLQPIIGSNQCLNISELYGAKKYKQQNVITLLKFSNSFQCI